MAPINKDKAISEYQRMAARYAAMARSAYNIGSYQAARMYQRMSSDCYADARELYLHCYSRKEWRR